jgi:hypothetical protein
MQPPESGAPAPASPDGEPTVEIALGPDQTIYPENLRPSQTPEAPTPLDDEAPEPDEATVSEPVDVAGNAPSPQQGETRGARRRAAEEAYQRGLTEGRTGYEQQLREQQQREQVDRTQREATQRVEQLFQLAESPDRNLREQAVQQILEMYRGNRQAQALTTATRQQILMEMAQDFGTLKDLDGIDEQGYQQLHTAPSAADLAKRAYDLGKKSKDEQVARLEAELQGLRGRLVGSRATPEAHNGGTSDIGGTVTIEEYLAMSPKEAKKLTSAQIDALTNQLAAAAGRNGRSF